MKTNLKKRLSDALLILGMILPFVLAMTLLVLTKPQSSGISITGAQIYLKIDMPIQPLYITEAHVVSLAVIISFACLCLFLTRNLKTKNLSKRQIIAEKIVTIADNFVSGNMGEKYLMFTPFLMSVMAISALSSLSSLLGLYPPTSDISIVGAWAIVSFVLITKHKLIGGVGPYLKGFTEPIFIFTPFNIIGELAKPVSMALRHYGNVLSGVVISTLIAYGLSGLSNLVLGWLPGVFGQFPFLRIGLPAVLSIYFDVISGCLQAFIFAILTALYIANGAPEDYDPRVKKSKKKKAKA